MKVKDLIAKLQTFDPEENVIVERFPDGCEDTPIGYESDVDDVVYDNYYHAVRIEA